MSPRNPVAKFNNEFNKPKTFRDRKKHPSKGQQREERQQRITELHHPLHEPYERDNGWKRDAVLVEDDADDQD